MRGQLSIFDGTDQSLLSKSIKLIKEFENGALSRNPRGYVVGYSGGKDSDVLVSLFIRAGVKFCIVHNHTTLDMPETVYYIKRKFSEWEQRGIPCKIYYCSIKANHFLCLSDTAKIISSPLNSVTISAFLLSLNLPFTPALISSYVRTK